MSDNSLLSCQVRATERLIAVTLLNVDVKYQETDAHIYWNLDQHFEMDLSWQQLLHFRKRTELSGKTASGQLKPLQYWRSVKTLSSQCVIELEDVYRVITEIC